MKKSKPNWFLRIVLVFFLCFLVMYISSISGYKEKRIHDKVTMTEEAIKNFESDVLAGKEVDINNYISNEYIDYSNGFTKTGDAITNIIQAFITDGLNGVWDTFRVLFW